MERLNPHKQRVLGAVAVSAALLVPLGIFGGPALARTASSAAEYQYGPSGKQYKVTVCHRTHGKKGGHTISVGAPAVKAHLHHGDTLGACAAGQQSAKHHGKAKGQHSDDHGAAAQQSSSSSSSGNQGHGQGNGNGNAGGNGNGNAGGNGNGGDHGNGKGKGK